VIQRGLPLEMMADPQPVLLQLLFPLTACQQRHIILGCAKDMRQITTDHT
jgi:hypothetical protein